MTKRKVNSDRLFDTVNITIVSILTLLILLPLIHILAASISSPDLVMSGKVMLFPKEITLDGYIRVFQDKDIVIGYVNTIFYTVAGTLINLVLTLTAAYALSKKRFVGRKVVMALIIFTMYFGGGMIPTYILMKDLGLLNTYMVLLICNGVSTYNLIVCRTFFINGVPSELEDSAMIDGCSTFKTFLRIVLPLSKALIGVMVLYYGIAHWNSYFNALIYISDRSKVPLQLVLREILVANEMKSQMMMTAKASATEELVTAQIRLASLIKYSVIVVSSVPVMIVYPMLQKYFDKGIMLGSLKG